MQTTVLREATPADFGWLFELRNSSDSLKWSRSQTTVSRSAHEKWLVGHGRERLIFVVGAEEGVVWLEREYLRWRLSVNLKPEARGKGLGKGAVIEAMREAWKVARHLVEAEVRRENTGAVRFFLGLEPSSVYRIAEWVSVRWMP